MDTIKHTGIHIVHKDPAGLLKTKFKEILEKSEHVSDKEKYTPLHIKLNCGCDRAYFNEEQLPQKDDICLHGNYFIKLSTE